jgi:spore germination protein
MAANPKDKISTAQAAVAVSSLIIGAGIITMTRSAARVIDSPDIWISVLLGGLIAIVSGIILVKLSQRFPEKTFYQYSGIIAGKPIGWMLSLFFIAYYIALAGFEARILSELVRTFLLKTTPAEVVIISFMSVGAYLVVGGINPIARAFELYFPVVIVIFLSVLLLGFQRFELDNLRPVLGQGLTPVLKGIPTTFLIYVGFEIMMILTAFMKEPQKAVKAVVIGTTIPCILYTFMSVVVAGVLTVDEVKTLTWPTATLINTIEYLGAFIENFQIFFMIVWVLSMYSTFVAAHYMASLGISMIFKKDYNIFVYALLPIIYLAAILPKNLESVFQFGDYIGYTGICTSGAVPLALLIIALIRRKGRVKKRNEE